MTDAILAALDGDRDGRVTEAEWSAAEKLLKADRDGDELIGAGELVPKVLYPGTAGTTTLTPPAAGDDRPPPKLISDLPIILLPGSPANTTWAGAVVRRRDANGDGQLSAAEAGFDAALFARLDGDHDGRLTASELTSWRKEKPAPVGSYAWASKSKGGRH